MTPFASVREHNHLFVYYRGNLIYKRWLDEDGNKTEPSALFTPHWPTVRITTTKGGSNA